MQVTDRLAKPVQLQTNRCQALAEAWRARQRRQAHLQVGQGRVLLAQILRRPDTPAAAGKLDALQRERANERLLQPCNCSAQL